MMKIHYRPDGSLSLRIYMKQPLGGQSLVRSSTRRGMATKFLIDKTTTWWVTTPKHTKKNANSTFSKDFVDFIGHLSLHCYSKMVDASYGFWEKVIWFSVHMFCGCLLLVFLSDAWSEFVHQYFATTLYDPLYPIENVPFPAVSICSNNRISQQAAAKYAEELSKLDPDARNTAYFMERIQLLGMLYDKDNFVETYDVINFQRFLDLYSTAENETYYNTLRQMRRLTPRCKDLLRRCTLAGRPIDCLSKESFQTTLTMYGYCCTFNANNIYRKRTQKNRFAQPELGLRVELNTSCNDMYYPILRMDGTVVLIHSPTKYPDTTSGGSLETFITNGEVNFLSITPYVVDSVEAMRQFSPKTRNCYFGNENPDTFTLGRSKYSFNNCITRCRIQSIMVLCKCLPFTYPYSMFAGGTNTVFCTLQHLGCLQRYRFKWRNILSHRVDIPGLERETEDALFCPQCLPSCDDITYDVSLNTLPLNYLPVDIRPPYNKTDITVVDVFFEGPHIKFYRQIVRNSWFEAFSTIGNFCGIIIGFSLTVVCEVIYFIGRQIVLALKRERQHGQQPLTIYP